MVRTELPLSSLKDIQAVFCDIDQTLLNDRSELDEETIEAVKALSVPFYLVSGRSDAQMESIASELGIRTVRLTLNGNVLVQDHQILKMIDTIPEKDLNGLFQEVNRRRGSSVSFQIWDEKEWYANSLSNPYIAYEIGVLHRKPILFKDANDIPSKKFVKALLIASEEDCDTFQNFAKPYGERVQIIRNHRTYVEILPKLASKGRGVEEVCRTEGYDPEECLSIGDSGVDVSLLLSTGFRAAVKNANIETKAVANIFLEDNNHAGVAELLRFVEDLKREEK